MSRDGSSPYPSLLSVETDDRKQFQCVNVVVNDETRGNPTFYRRQPTQQTINFWFRENVVYTIFKANAWRGVTVDNFPVVLIFQKKTYKEQLLCYHLLLILKPCYNYHCICASSRVHSEILGKNNFLSFF